jgi:glycosyltransferase involved in cell wall biosynthesis
MYNAQSTICIALESVLRQTYLCDFEIIVINDGSTDISEQIVENFIVKTETKNIILIKKANGGAASARNAGLKLATGEYIAFLDSDDEWFPNKLAIQMDYLSHHPDVYMLGGKYGQGTPDRFLIKLEKIMRIGIKHQVLKNFFQPSTVIFRRKILDKVGYFDETMRYAEEGFFFNKIVAYYKSIYMSTNFAASISNKRRWGDSGLSGNVVKMEAGELHNIKAAYRSKFISLMLFLFAYTFSIIKFCRRYITLEIRKIMYGNKK